MEMENIFTLISNVGFPIVICLYLLTRIEHKIEGLSTAIKDLNNTLIKLETLSNNKEKNN